MGSTPHFDDWSLSRSDWRTKYESFFRASVAIWWWVSRCLQLILNERPSGPVLKQIYNENKGNLRKVTKMIQKNNGFSITLKYLTVLTRSSSVASSSHTIIVLRCIWSALTVHIWLTPSSIALYRANDLRAPVTKIITFMK